MAIASAPSIYELHQVEDTHYFEEIDDALAICASVFGGGFSDSANLSLYELNNKAQKAIKLKTSE